MKNGDMRTGGATGLLLAAALLTIWFGPRPAAAQSQSERMQLLELAHRVVVEEAVDVLPDPLKNFYKDHRQEMPSQGLEPEFPPRSPERRFLVDRLQPFPFKGLPHSEQALKAKFGEEAEQVGRLPWLIHDSYERLLETFRAEDKGGILLGSDEIAGYMVDLNGPLNLTRNFDGQETGQHGLWLRVAEKLPQAMGGELHLKADAANFLDKPKEYVFSVMLESYVWADNILYLDELAHRGKAGYSAAYFDAFARRAGPILRERLSHAAEDAASYWYTAWTEAGRPELESR